MSRGRNGISHELTAGIRPKMTLPIAALRMLITIKLANAPPNTVILGCRVAMIAAIRNVLSPVESLGDESLYFPAR